MRLTQEQPSVRAPSGGRTAGCPGHTVHAGRGAMARSVHSIPQPNRPAPVERHRSLGAHPAPDDRARRGLPPGPPERPAGHRRVAPRRPGRAAPVPVAVPPTGRSPSRAAACSAASPSPTRPGASWRPTADNAVLVCHALTGDSHAAGGLDARPPDARVVGRHRSGPGRALDTDRWFVVCVNVLGGCQGTTGPASPHPDDGRPWASRFPVVSIRDMVRTQAAVADHLGHRPLGARWSAGRWAACRCSSGA